MDLGDLMNKQMRASSCHANEDSNVRTSVSFHLLNDFSLLEGPSPIDLIERAALYQVDEDKNVLSLQDEQTDFVEGFFPIA